MRLWSIHPQYLDRIGLIALWREGLLAQKVLLGQTRGYTNHPQLERFKSSGNPVGAIATYLRYIAQYATVRGHSFNSSKVVSEHFSTTIPVTIGQADYEFSHLLKKCITRSPEHYTTLKKNKTIVLHPLFSCVNGTVAGWEKVHL